MLADPATGPFFAGLAPAGCRALAAPATGVPWVAGPGAARPALAEPDAGRPPLAAPDGARPALAEPGTERCASAGPDPGRVAVTAPVADPLAMRVPGAGRRPGAVRIAGLPGADGAAARPPGRDDPGCAPRLRRPGAGVGCDPARGDELLGAAVAGPCAARAAGADVPAAAPAVPGTDATGTEPPGTCAPGIAVPGIHAPCAGAPGVAGVGEPVPEPAGAGPCPAGVAAGPGVCRPAFPAAGAAERDGRAAALEPAPAEPILSYRYRSYCCIRLMSLAPYSGSVAYTPVSEAAKAFGLPRTAMARR